MQKRLTAPEQEHLAAAYRGALTHAPTRPHPRGPHTGWPGHAAFRFHALWDGLLDGVDSRPGAPDAAIRPGPGLASLAATAAQTGGAFSPRTKQPVMLSPDNAVEAAPVVGAASAGRCPAASYSPTRSPAQYHRR